MGELMIYLIRDLIRGFQLVLTPLCFLMAWLILVVTLGTIYRAIASTIHQAKEMHQIPCTGCQFFTNDHRLKCPVQPKIALTEDAIGCRDYWEKKR
jgi:hypothetical protein